MKYLIWIMLIGILAGWLSGKILKGRGFGLVGDLIVGVVGAAIGSILFRAIGIYAYGFIGTLIMATIGALTLLFAIRVITGKQ